MSSALRKLVSSRLPKGTAAALRRRELPVINKRSKRSRRKMRKTRRSKITKDRKVSSSRKGRTSSLIRSWKISQKNLSNVSKKLPKIVTPLLLFSSNACNQAAPTTQILHNNPYQRRNPSSRSTTSANSTQTAVLVSPAQKNTSITLRRN